jgi:hypothetical protein
MSLCYCACHYFAGRFPDPCDKCGHDNSKGHFATPYHSQGWVPDPEPSTLLGYPVVEVGSLGIRVVETEDWEPNAIAVVSKDKITVFRMEGDGMREAGKYSISLLGHITPLKEEKADEDC